MSTANLSLSCSPGRLELYDLNRDFEENLDLSDVSDLAPRTRALSQVMLEKLGPFGENN